MSSVPVLRYSGTLKNWRIETRELSFALWSFLSSVFLVLNQHCFAEVPLKTERLGIQRKCSCQHGRGLLQYWPQAAQGAAEPAASGAGAGSKSQMVPLRATFCSLTL